MTDPLIHFLLPYVGRLDYLQECVSSVIAQSDPRWRLTVVEDGDQGTDAGSWIAEIGDPRVEHRLNPTPLGLCGNFSHCLDLAEAPYLVMLGCDDRVLDSYVAVVGELLEVTPTASLVQPGVEVIDSEGSPARTLVDVAKGLLRPRRDLTLLRGQRAAVSLMRGNWLYFPSLCWRTDVIRALGFRADLPTTLDLELVCRLVLAGHSIIVSPRPAVFQYRRHGASASSLTASDVTRFTEERSLFGELERSFAGHGWRRARRAARWHPTSRLHALTLLPRALASTDGIRTRRILEHSFGARSDAPDAT